MINWVNPGVKLLPGGKTHPKFKSHRHLRRTGGCVSYNPHNRSSHNRLFPIDFDLRPLCGPGNGPPGFADHGGSGLAGNPLWDCRIPVSPRLPEFVLPLAHPSPLSASRTLTVLIAVLILTFFGCSRAFYRRQADHEVFGLIQESSHNPHQVLPRFTIQPDQYSRMYDPFSPDHPPMPADDPAAHRLMHCVDCKKGYPCWHENGDTDFVESPIWLACLPVDESGTVTLDIAGSMRLALLHSRDYQRQFETLYLSALDVSAERFLLDTQLFGGYEFDYRADGRNRTGSGGASASLLQIGTFAASPGVNLNVRKTYSTGAELAVGLANSIVWQFSGSDTNTTTTLLDFTLFQPLLRRAGRDRVLETLTIAERTLLANVRQIERYRRGFYVHVITGRGTEQGPVRRGGVFGVSGLAGFSGVGGGGFGRVTGGGGGGGGGGGAGAGHAGGYLGLLQSQQDIRNQETNIAGLRSNLYQFQETLAATEKASDKESPENVNDILRQRLQVAQSRQALYNAQSRLLNSQNAYQAALDAFKVRLGLPPDLCVTIEDPLLDQFHLIDPDMLPRQNEITALRVQAGIIAKNLRSLARYETHDGQEIGKLEWSEQLASHLSQLRASLPRNKQVCEQFIAKDLRRARADVERLKQVLPSRREDVQRVHRKYLDELNRSGHVKYGREFPADVDPAIFDVARLDSVPEKLNKKADRIAADLDRYYQNLESLDAFLKELLQRERDPDPEALYKALKSHGALTMPSALSDLVSLVLDLSLLQARTRTHSIRLVPVELTAVEALDIARTCRRDWKNARAALVDSWRLIEFNANDLESALDVEFSGDISNRGDNPANLSNSTGRLNVRLEFDAPFTRHLERNNYRQSLIEYQQAKRGYTAFKDGVSQSLRDTLRTLDLHALNFEQQRIALLGAIEQIVFNDGIQTFAQQQGQASGATAARDTVSALADLQNAQDNFLSVWINYQVLRHVLDLDLGTMQLDEHGRWLDPGTIGVGYGLISCGQAAGDDGDATDVPSAQQIIPVGGGIPARELADTAGAGSRELKPDVPPNIMADHGVLTGSLLRDP